MIRIICGEDINSALNYFNQIKSSFRKNNYQLIDVNCANIAGVLSQIESNLSLFNQKIAYFGQFLFPSLTKNKNLFKKIKKINADKETVFYIYEDKKKYDLNLYKEFKIIEFKLTNNLFTLLDLFLPGKKISFLKLFHQIINEKNENLFFYLLTKRVRQLLVIKNEGIPEEIKAWQLAKLKKQAQFWEREKLINAYQSLFRIEIDQKTSQTPFSLSQSLDIFGCYHLS